MPLSKDLNNWIAESGSWQAFIDFKLPDDERAGYQFLKRADDFYLSLMSSAFQLLRDEKYDELLSVAKGLEIFSLRTKAENFTGVNRQNNLLYAAAFYYLSGYPASAWILSKISPNDQYHSSLDKFLHSFLSRGLHSTSGSERNQFQTVLTRYFDTGSQRLLKLFVRKIELIRDRALNQNFDLYCSATLAFCLIKKFKDDNIWSDLLNEQKDEDHWVSYIKENLGKKVPVWNFFPSQKEALRKGILKQGTCSLQMPTSAGKTSMSELIVYNEFKSNPNCRVLYLAPFRALASELKNSLAFNLARLGVRSKTIYGGNIPSAEERSSIDDINLLIATPEKFLAIEDVSPGISDSFTTIICDEGHLLDDGSRGLSYELLLSRLKQVNQSTRRLIFISAIIPNISIINSWLGGSDESLITSTYRPTELEFALVRRMTSKSVGYYLDVNPTRKKPVNFQLYKYLLGHELRILNPKTQKLKRITSKKGLSVAVAVKALGSGSVALFAPHKRGDTGVEGLAEELINQINYRDNVSLARYSTEEYLNDLHHYFSIVFGEDYLLSQASKCGFLYHHGDFPQSIREIIEDALRQGQIQLVICTNTLAEGVNLPLKTIVIHSTKRYNPNVVGKWETLQIRDLKNLVGRAGRAGKETKGLVIIPHEEDFDTILKLIDNSKIEEVHGQLYNIIKQITRALTKRKLVLSAEILDSLNDEFQNLLDSIDISLIDLLSEEVKTEELQEIITKLLEKTLSYYQSNTEEKATLETLFFLRSEKLIPIIEADEFKIIKNSGVSIRLYREITELIDFEHPIWDQSFDSLNDEWLSFILDNGIFKISKFQKDLSQFNKDNDCEIDPKDVRKAIQLWMGGVWFEELSQELDIAIFQSLRLVNSLLGFNVQSIIAYIIRIKELKSEGYEVPLQISNWPSYLQHGLVNATQLNLVNMGLIDRVAVIEMEKLIKGAKIETDDYDLLKVLLLSVRHEIEIDLQPLIPAISFTKVKKFLLQLNNINMI